MASALVGALSLLGVGSVPAAAAAGLPTVTAVSPIAGPVGGTSRPAINRAASFPVTSETTGNRSIVVAPAKVGDLVIVSMQLHSTAVSVTSVSGGNVGSWQRAASYTNTTTDVLHYEVWWGVAAATGSSAVQLNYTGPATSWAIELIADSFTSGTVLPWSVVTSGGTSSANGTTVTWPALTSGTAADQLYWGASEEESAGTSTSSPGFASTLSGFGNCFLYDGGLAPLTPYAPTCGETPSQVATTVGVIFAAGGPGGSGSGTQVTLTGTDFAAGDTVHFGAAAASAVSVTSSTSLKALAPTGDPSVIGGTVDVTVTSPTGTSATTPSDEFTYRVTSSSYTVTLTASSTSPLLGEQVVLTAVCNVNVGPTPYGMSIVDASTGSILVHAGTGSSATATVAEASPVTQRYVAEVDTAGGGSIQANSAPVVVQWHDSPPPVPSVDAVSPSTGPSTGGTTVTVQGGGFNPTTGDAVHFGGTPATGVQVTSTSSLRATAPAGSGTVDVIITDLASGRASAKSTNDQFTYVAPTPGGTTGGTSGGTLGGTSGGTPGRTTGGTSGGTAGGTKGGTSGGTSGGSIPSTPPVTKGAGSGGYALVASDGGIFAFTAAFHGSMGGKSLDQPIVGMAEDVQTGGYYEVASDGGIFAFDAPFHGSMGGKTLNQPIVGMAATPTGGGYYEVASDGGIFAFGNARFYGSMGSKTLNQPIVGMAATPTGGGYYEVASDGGLFAFGAPFAGSMGGMPLNQPIVAMSVDPHGGYWEFARDGGVFAFGGAPSPGSVPGMGIHVTDVVGAAAVG